MAPQQTYAPPPPYYPPPPPPSWSDWNGPKSMGGRHQEATQTVTNYVTISSAATSTPYPFADQGSSPFSSAAPSHSGDSHHSNGNHNNNNNNNNHHSLSSGVMAAAGVIATLVFVAVLLGLCCFFCRKSRKSKNTERSVEEIIVPAGMVKLPDARAYMKPPVGSPPPSSSQSSSSSIPLNRRPNSQVPPIILSTTMDHSYFTGIDSSDHISLADNHSTRSADPEEPPPPYRPRSVPPISRECSVRIADGMLPHYMPGNSIPSTEVLTHNPFDDPDGGVSDLEEDAPVNNTTTHDDHLSIVSDLSYQQEPTATHSTI